MDTELKDVLEAVLIDLIEARHAANEFSMSISPRYTDSGDLSGFATPALDIGNVKVDIRFAVQPAAQSGASDREEVSSSARGDKVLGAIRTSVLESLDATVAEGISKRERNELSMQLTNAVRSGMDPKTLNMDASAVKSQARRVLSKQLLTRRARGLDTRAVDRAVDNIVERAGERVREAAEAESKKQARRASFIVDSQELNKLDPATVSSLSLDLDVSSLEWTSDADE